MNGPWRVAMPPFVLLEDAVLNVLGHQCSTLRAQPVKILLVPVSLSSPLTAQWAPGHGPGGGQNGE